MQRSEHTQTIPDTSDWHSSRMFKACEEEFGRALLQECVPMTKWYTFLVSRCSKCNARATNRVLAQLYALIILDRFRWGYEVRQDVWARRETSCKRFFTILIIWLLQLFSRQKGGMKGKESSTGRLSKAQTVAFISLVWFGSQCSDGAFQTFQSISWSWSFLQTWSQMVSEADLAAGRKISVPTSHDPSQTQCGMIFLGTSTCRRLSWWRRSASMSFLSPEPLEKAWDLEKIEHFPYASTCLHKGLNQLEI